MGQEVTATVFSREDRQRYRRKVRTCLDVFARMLSEARFDSDRRSFGLEIELNLTDEAGDPALVNARALEVIADADFQTEIGQFNIEINVPPRTLADGVFSELEEAIRLSLNRAEERSRTIGAHMMIIGILPTVGEQHLTSEVFSAGHRYSHLNEQIFAARGEDLEISITGVERLATFADTIAPESACTSVQLHLQTEPEGFADHWNAAQAIAGPQVAVAANSPFFYGRELWRETRIALFEQATDTRPEELKVQGVRPRVWFGERWITSIFDLFEENVRFFPALLPVCDKEDPVEVLERGDTPGAAGAPPAQRDHLPLEPADLRHQPRASRTSASRIGCCRQGPTVVDICANAAFYYGLVRSLVAEERPLWSQMSFSAAEENFHAGARDGLDAHVYWPGVGEVPVAELMLRRLLPAAHAGLEDAGVAAADRERLLGIVERRCVTMQNGASWQAASFHRLYDDKKLDRVEALRRMTVLYREHMHAQ